MGFIQDQCRHGKALLVLGEAKGLLDQAGVSNRLPNGEVDPGIVLSDGVDQACLNTFINAIARHRHPQREIPSDVSKRH